MDIGQGKENGNSDEKCYVFEIVRLTYGDRKGRFYFDHRAVCRNQ